MEVHGGGAGQAGTDVVVAAGRVVVVPVGHCDVGRVAVPAAAPNDADGARRRPWGVAACAAGAVPAEVPVVPVVRPLPDVPAHAVEVPGVRPERGDVVTVRPERGSGVVVPGHVRRRVRPRIWRVLAGARRVLPLGFGWQAVPRAGVGISDIRRCEICAVRQVALGEPLVRCPHRRRPPSRPCRRRRWCRRRCGRRNRCPRAGSRPDRWLRRRQGRRWGIRGRRSCRRRRRGTRGRPGRHRDHRRHSPPGPWITR